MTPVGTYTGFDVFCDMDSSDGGWLVIFTTCLVFLINFTGQASAYSKFSHTMEYMFSQMGLYTRAPGDP